MRVWTSAIGETFGVAADAPAAERPRLASLALPAGLTSDGEVLDAYVEQMLSCAQVKARLNEVLPAGLRVSSVVEIGLSFPSLQADVRWADYGVVPEPGVSRGELAAAVERFLALKTLPWEQAFETRVKRYDIRDTVMSLRLFEVDGSLTLVMRLRTDVTGAGRPEQVLLALGLPPAHRIHRLRTGFATVSPAMEAWRRRGRFQEVSG
jgi:radical SAM-linked protein